MINPVGMTLREFADGVSFTTPDAWPIPRLDDEEHWQSWATVLLRAYGTQGVPNPYEFSDWREWAQRAYPMLEVTT